MAAIAPHTKLDGKYVVKRLLGEGGFGRVFLAEDLLLPHRPVAIKVIDNPRANEKREMLWEMEHLSRLKHPGVTDFFHHFEHGGHLCLVMEFCPGGSLAAHLERVAPCPAEQVFEWGLRLCETLAAVHAQGIAHHDIKPQNILFGHDGAIKLGDFGVANRCGGTIVYMAPEQLVGEKGAHLDTRCDIYALGLTLLEALTGEQPFHGLGDIDQLRRQWRHDFVPETLPRWVQEILLRATHPTPESRFQDMQQFAEAIRAKHVAFSLDRNRLRAGRFAEQAEQALARQQWRRALALTEQALDLCADSIPGLLASARCHLLLRRLDRAKSCFERAQALSPRTPIHKHLAWIHLEQGRIPPAISLLTDHLQRHPTDYEAYNLLLKCYFLTERWEAGSVLAREVVAQRAPSQCFASNALLFDILSADGVPEPVDELLVQQSDHRFLDYNLMVADEVDGAWAAGDRPSLASKLLFEEYRFGLSGRRAPPGVPVVHLSDSWWVEADRTITSIGSLKSNDIVLDDRGVSRRHALLVNIGSEVWLHDLSSTVGTRVDGQAVEERVFLEGVHVVHIGRRKLRIAARRDILI